MSLVFLAGAVSAPAQDDNSSKEAQGQPPKPAGTTGVWPAANTDDDAKAAPAAEQGPVNQYDGSIKQAGTGLPLLGTSTTPLRWGDFSIGSFEYFGIHDKFVPVGANPAFLTNLSILRTSLVFDRMVFKNRIFLQYLPQLAIYNGQFHANAGANNAVAFGWVFSLTPRMTVTVQNGFLQVHSNQLIPEHHLATDAYAGAVVQNNFLDTNGSFLADTVTATLKYDLSSRTNFTISPMYRYAQATNNLPNYLANGQTYQGVATLGHALSPRRTIGIMESYQVLRETAATVPVYARFNTAGVFYSEQVLRSMWVTGNLGADHESYSDRPGAAPWGFSGGFTLLEDFSKRVGLALAYTRGVMFDNYVTTRRSDRVDASLGFHITRRLVWSNSGGYFREIGPEPHTTGKYAQSGISLGLFSHVELFSTYVHSFQASSTPQILSGTRDTVAYGVRWLPPVHPMK